MIEVKATTDTPNGLRLVGYYRAGRDEAGIDGTLLRAELDGPRWHFEITSASALAKIDAYFDADPAALSEALERAEEEEERWP